MADPPLTSTEDLPPAEDRPNSPLRPQHKELALPDLPSKSVAVDPIAANQPSTSQGIVSDADDGKLPVQVYTVVKEKQNRVMLS